MYLLYSRNVSGSIERSGWRISLKDMEITQRQTSWSLCISALSTSRYFVSVPRGVSQTPQCLRSAPFPASTLWASGYCSSEVWLSSPGPSSKSLSLCSMLWKWRSIAFKCAEYLTEHDKVNIAVVSTHFLFVIMVQSKHSNSNLKNPVAKVKRVRVLPWCNILK